MNVCLSVCLFVFLCVYICLSFCPSVFLFVCLSFCLSVSLCMLCAYVPTSSYISSPGYLQMINPSLPPLLSLSLSPTLLFSLSLPVCLPVCLSICLSVCPSVCLSVCSPPPSLSLSLPAPISPFGKSGPVQECSLHAHIEGVLGTASTPHEVWCYGRVYNKLRIFSSLPF